MPLRQREKVQEVLRETERLIPVAIVAFWLVMMGLLVHREVVIPRLHADKLPARLTESRDQWMGIFAGGQRTGFGEDPLCQDQGVHELYPGLH